MDAETLRRRFADDEQRFARKFGLQLTTRFIHVPAVPQPVRVIESGSGPTVFMLHGGPAFAGVWIPLMAELDDVHLVAVDRPGYGLTGFFDYYGVDYRGFAVSFLDQVLTKLQLERVPVVASSMGGLWTLWLAQEHPERLSSIVQLGCPPFVLQHELPLPFRLLATPPLNRFMLSFERPSPKQIRKVFSRMGHSNEVMDYWPSEFWELSLAFEQLPDYQRGWLTELEQTRRLKDRALKASDLAQLKQPTLFIWGQHDIFGGPEIGHRAVRTMSHASIEIIDGGHLPWLDAPAFCAKCIAEFLENGKTPSERSGADLAERRYHSRRT